METTPAQLEAITHPAGPLLILGGAGTGKTHTLVERFAWLTEHGTPADAILALTFSTAAADELREQIETRMGATAYEELSVTTVQALCARLLREEALEAGIDPFAAPVTAADRLVMLLERIDELPLASHDLRGNPSAMLGSIVQRIDRLKDELVTVGDYEAWAAKLPEDGETARAKAAREREFAAIYAAHDRLLAEAGTLDAGDLVLHALTDGRDTPPTGVTSDAVPLVGRVGGVIVVGRLAKSHQGSISELAKQLRQINAPTLGVVINSTDLPRDTYRYYGEHSRAYVN